MIKLIINYFNINRLHNIYTIVIICIMFMMFRTYVDEVIQNERVLDYAESFDDNLYLIDIVGKQDIGLLKQRFGANVGYSYMNVAYNKEFDESFACYYVNEFYSEKAIVIKKGRALSYENNQNEVLIFGSRLQSKYGIGDTVTLGRGKYTVVGYVGSYDYLLCLFRSCLNSKTNIKDASERSLNGDMFISNNLNNKSDFATCNMALVDTYTDEYRKIMSLETIKENTYEQIGEDKRFHMLGIIMLGGLILYSVWSLMMMQSKRCGKLLSIYYINGISKKAYMTFSILANGAIIICANILYIILYVVEIFNGVFFQSNTMGTWCIYSSIILSIVLIMVEIVCDLFIIKKSALEIKRKYG